MNIAWPEIAGLRSFGGGIIPSARWIENYAFENKRIGVIGSGSSAIQIVPNLREISGTQLSCFVRSKTWISPPFGQALWDSLGMTSFEFSEDQKRRFHEDPEYYYKFRMDIEQGGNAEHEVTITGTAKQKSA
ncbi:hypothetical protein BJ546DRAFT_233795 [Cryomyces antarcticus]